MKKKALVLMLLVLLFPMFVKAAEIVDNDAKIKYTVDESVWKREDVSESDVKMWTNDCGTLTVRHEDIYEDNKHLDLPRDKFNYNYIFYNEELTEDLSKAYNDGFFEKSNEIKHFKEDFIHITDKSIDPLYGNVNYSGYMTIINGYQIFFIYESYENYETDACVTSFNKIVENAEATIKVKSKYSIMPWLLNLIGATICFMIYPFIRTKFMGVTYKVNNYKKMALFNSIIVGAVGIGLQLLIGGKSAFVDNKEWMSVLPVIFYFINRWVWFEKGNKKVDGDLVPVFKNEDKLFRTEKSTVKLFKCDNCGALVSEFETKCPACGEVFEEDEEEVKEEPKKESKKEPKKEPKKEEKTKKFKCDNCGALVDEDATKCPYCGETFEDEEEVKEEPKKKEKKQETKMVFKCDNCGALVPEDAVKCPSCGESFEDEEEEIKEEPKKKEVKVEKEVKEEVSVDQKYSDLKKLKELLDNDIITKAEFDKEKKKILK